MTKESYARLGTGTRVEVGAQVGFVYRTGCQQAVVGKHGIIRSGSILYADVRVGDYFQTGHQTVIRAFVEAGDYCTVSNQSTLEGLIRLGDGVRIMSQVYVPSRTVFGNHIFVGPGVVFLNERYPGRQPSLPSPVGAIIEDEVVIGGGAIVLPGVRIGAGSFIAAGALVNRDVPPKSLVVGLPGRIQPLPQALDRPNSRSLTQQPLDLWHPDGPDPATLYWPPHLGRRPLAGACPDDPDAVW